MSDSLLDPLSDSALVSRLQHRAATALRPHSLQLSPFGYAAGAVLIEVGNTKVLCCASVEEKVPAHKRGSGSGWVTAEYSMLPAATHSRNEREASKGKLSGRTQEIQRLIGRSLRAVTDLKLLGERQVIVDCDVLQADGGTRTASITGGCVALMLALHKLMVDGKIKQQPVRELVAAVSVGMRRGQVLLDLDYEEDSACDVDMNVVMTQSAGLVEVQGTAEGEPFSRAAMEEMLNAAQLGIAQLLRLQQSVLPTAGGQ